MEFVKPDLYDGIPVYRVMDRKGHVIRADQDPNVKESHLYPRSFRILQFIGSVFAVARRNGGEDV